MKLLLLAMLSACAQLTIKDFTACAVMPGQSGAACDHYLTSDQTVLTEQEWIALSPGYLCISPTDYGNIKNELEIACSQLNCSYDQLQTMHAATQRFDILPKVSDPVHKP
jgi:hypothetical protein